MSALITADTHWNDNPRDESRWGLLDWLGDQHADELLILGDLTVAKNNHPARMVNRLVDKFILLSKKYRNIYILAGNHDYTDPECPFFLFMRHTKDNIHFVWVPTLIHLTIGDWVFMPAGTDWAGCLDLIRGNNVFTHATFTGAISESGFSLTGIDTRYALEATRVISGDVHKNQKMANGAIEYVGAPYHIHFGDNFEPHILRLEKGKYQEYLHYPSPRKFSQVIKSLDELYRIKIKAGDQIKIIVQMRRADLPDWKNWRDAIREQAEKEGWLLFGPELKLQPDTKPDQSNTTAKRSHEDLIDEYATRHKTSKQHSIIGQELLKSVR